MTVARLVPAAAAAPFAAAAAAAVVAAAAAAAAAVVALCLAALLPKLSSSVVRGRLVQYRLLLIAGSQSLPVASGQSMAPCSVGQLQLYPAVFVMRLAVGH